MLGLRFIHVASCLVALANQAIAAMSVDWESITTSRGDHLPDFSFCGYHSTEAPLPSTSTSPNITLTPTSGDQTSRIQAALDQVSSGGGGVVALGAGTFRISGGLILTSNTILRGAGVGSTKLSLSTLTAGVSVITLGNGTQAAAAVSHATKITDDYVGVGATEFTVANATGFEANQVVFVQRAVTKEWVEANGMANLTAGTWLGPGRLVQQLRFIKSISGNNVTLKVPLTDSLDSQYMKPQLVAFKEPTHYSEMGVENLSINLSPTCSGVVITNATCITPAISFNPWTFDSYVRNVNLTGFNSFIRIQYNSSRITIQDVGMNRNNASDGSAGWASDIAVLGSQVLIQDCEQSGTARAFAVATMSLTPGPNAVLRHIVHSTWQQIYPHERWAHGFLAENTNAEVYYVNRGEEGTGQGWSINAGVAWNVGGQVAIEDPPLGFNWCIGCTGSQASGSNSTSFIDAGKTVSPPSLFAAQLAART